MFSGLGSADVMFSQHGGTYECGLTKSENDEYEDASAPKSPTVKDKISSATSHFGSTLSNESRALNRDVRAHYLKTVSKNRS